MRSKKQEDINDILLGTSMIWNSPCVRPIV